MANLFWIDTLRAWVEFNQINTPVTLDKCLTMPLWKNPLIDTDCKGIRTVSDFTEDEFNILN